jgi:hypothetical protein
MKTVLTTICLLLIVFSLSGCHSNKKWATGYRIALSQKVKIGNKADSSQKSETDQSQSGDGDNTKKAEVEVDKLRIYVGVTNISGHVMCDLKASMSGVPTIEPYEYGIDSCERKALEDDSQCDGVKSFQTFHPGGVWFIDLKDDFECRIPLRVDLEFRYIKIQELPKIGKQSCSGLESRWLRERDIIVDLPKKPTAIRNKFLLACGPAAAKNN